MAGKTYFAPLPPRAITDGRLTGLDLRILAAVAMHDRMSAARGKGAGCYVDHSKLAKEVGCAYTSLSDSLTKLGTYGYVDREAHPLNKRLRIYRVKYTEADTAFVMAARAQDSSPSSEQLVRQPAKNEASIVRRPKSQPTEPAGETTLNIFSEAVPKKYSEAGKYTPEGGQPIRKKEQDGKTVPDGQAQAAFITAVRHHYGCDDAVDVVRGYLDMLPVKSANTICKYYADTTASLSVCITSISQMVGLDVGAALERTTIGAAP